MRSRTRASTVSSGPVAAGHGARAAHAGAGGVRAGIWRRGRRRRWKGGRRRGAGRESAWVPLPTPGRAQEDQAENPRGGAGQDAQRASPPYSQASRMLLVNHNNFRFRLSLVQSVKNADEHPHQKHQGPAEDNLEGGGGPGRSIYWWRIQAMTPSSTQTTRRATMVAN